MKAVMTQAICSTPLSSPTMVGSALESTVWFSDASSMVTMRPANSRTILRCVGIALFSGCAPGR